MTRYFRPVDIAKSLGINLSKVSAWIRAGDLEAIDVSLRRGQKPRWRISAAALEAFLLRRSSPKSTPRATTTRRSKDAGTIEFF